MFHLRSVAENMEKRFPTGKKSHDQEAFSIGIITPSMQAVKLYTAYRSIQNLRRRKELSSRACGFGFQ
ncbi:hypothetical protein OBV_33290 [Oscillibacter valericigenes Sjm18-20]|nr:hypothetical protein OBV_33290 [Oscillibacter valericigenes Sjm18-20]